MGVLVLVRDFSPKRGSFSEKNKNGGQTVKEKPMRFRSFRPNASTLLIISFMVVSCEECLVSFLLVVSC